ncbi:MAG: hypothetical protein WCD37_04275 [Chloroflexia bacterium]
MSRVVAVDLTDTLMRLDSYFGVHVQSGERHSTYYFRVPDGWADLESGELEGRVMGVMLGVYREHNERLQRAEPDDPNYLAPLGVACRVLTPEEEVGKPWVAAGSPALWEWTPCVVVGEDGGYEKVEVGEF